MLNGICESQGNLTAMLWLNTALIVAQRPCDHMTIRCHFQVRQNRRGVLPFQDEPQNRGHLQAHVRETRGVELADER